MFLASGPRARPTKEKNMIITDRAREQLRPILAENAGMGLRISIAGYG